MDDTPTTANGTPKSATTAQEELPVTPLPPTPKGAPSILESVSMAEGGVDNPAFIEAPGGEGVDLEPDAAPPSPPAGDTYEEALVEAPGEAPVEAPGEVSGEASAGEAPGEASEEAPPPVAEPITTYPIQVDSTDSKDSPDTEKKNECPPTIDVTSSEQVETKAAMATVTTERVTVTTGNKLPYDRVLPSDQIWVTEKDAAVKLRMGTDTMAAETPVSVPSTLMDTASKAPNHLALVTKGSARTWTYHQYLRDVRLVAKGFIKFGLEPFHAVGILGFNAPEWNISLLGAIFAGGISSGIYTTNSPEAVHYVLEHCEANIVVVENEEQLNKVLKVRDRLPALKAVIQYTGDLGAKRSEGVHTWKELLEAGQSVHDNDLEARTRLCAANRCCSLIYTSGTTGEPKAVMLSHDNVTWTSKCVIQQCRFRWSKEVTVSFLPLSHIAAQLCDVFLAITAASTVHFAQPDALKGSLVETLKEVRPTAFIAVPRVWEKISEKLRELGKQTKGCKKKISTWAKGVGLRSNIALMNGQSPPLAFKVANAIMFKKVKAALGLDRCHSFYSGAAPITRDTLEYFMSLNMPITEIYGMSESTGPHHIGVAWDFQLGTVGPVMPGVKTDLLDKDKDGNGEICFSGRHVFMGYLKNVEKTKEAIDSRGLLHSGDIGKWDENGRYISITGRIKELIITAGGENVAPVPIEEVVKHELPIVSNAMLIGDKRKFLSILLTLKTMVDPDTMVPGDQLTSEAVDWVHSVGSLATTVSQILETTDVRVMRGIQAGLDRANQQAVSRAQKVQKWSILPIDFSVPGGELGPTLKVKRPVAARIYTRTIEAFYRGT